MGLTGERLKGKELVKCGVATHFVPQSKIPQLRQTIIDKTDETTDLKKLQEIIKEYAEIIYSSDIFSFPKSEDVRNIFKVDSLEEIFQRLESLHSNPNSTPEQKTWAEHILKHLKSYSPISLAVCLEQVKRGLKMKSNEEGYNLEAQIVSA
jgi:3-hydroxyisobutyryl-CoA hydrolase